MKITREDRTRPLITLSSGTGGTGGAPSGQVPVATGSNGTFAWGSNVSHIYSNGSNHLLGPFVNFASGSGISFAAASNTLTISATGGGGGSADLPWYHLVDDFGAVCDNATDDLAAWQDAVDTMAAAGGGLCIVPGLSEVSGDIVMPDVDYADSEAITIGFVGVFPPPGVPSVIGATPLTENGPGIRVTDANGTVFSGTSAAGLDNFTNVNLLLRNLVVRSPANPTGHCIDALKFANVDFENVQVDASSLNVGGYALQTTATSFGIRLPRVNNGAKVRMKDVNVVGFYNGVQVSEHANLDGVFVWASRRPWVFEGSYHAANLTRCGWYHCKQGIEFVAGPYEDESRFTWSHLNIERSDAGTWTQTGDDVVDGSDFGAGAIYGWHAVLANTGTVHTFVNGGANVYAIEMGEDPFGGAIDYGETGDISDLDFDDVADAGVLDEVARADHVHGMPAEPSSGGSRGAILLESGHAVPFTFDEILQESDGSDFLYASE